MSRGRPKAFDESEVLDRAMDYFWTHGYRASGITELTDHLGIARQSLYRTFGSKRDLFLKVVDRYRDTQLSTALALLDQEGSPLANVRAAIRFFQQLAADQRARGCLVANALVEVAPEDPELAAVLGTILDTLEAAFATTLAKARAAGELDGNPHPRILARTLTNAVIGMAVTGRLGKGRAVVTDACDGTLALLD